MIVTFEGRDWNYDPAGISVDEWRELKRKYKMTPRGFTDGVDDADPDAMTFLYWVLLRNHGQPSVTLGDHLKPDVIALNNAVGTAVEQERAAGQAQAKAELEAAAAKAAEVGPTQPGGPTSPEPPSPPDTTLTPPGQPVTEPPLTVS